MILIQYTDIIDILVFVFGGEFAGMNDVVDVREVTGLSAATEQPRALSVRDLVGKLAVTAD